MLTMKATMRRAVKLVRNEECPIEIKLIPLPLFHEVTEQTRQEAIAELKNLTKADFDVNQWGEVSISAPYYRQFFKAEVRELREFEYDGSEVSTVATTYARSLVDV